VKKPSEPAVYSVYSYTASNFLFTFKDIRNKEVPAINWAEINYLRIEHTDQPTIEVEPVVKGEFYNTAFSRLKMIKPYKDVPLSSDKFGKYMEETPPVFQIQDFVNDRPSGAELRDYGLNPPLARLVARDEGQTTFHLLAGKDAGSGTAYAKLGDGTSVFTLNKSDLALLEAKPFELMDKFILILNLDYVESFTVEGPRGTYTAEIERTVVEEAESQEEEPEIEETFLLNGTPVADDGFRKYYQEVIGLLGDVLNTEDVVYNPEVTITYTLNEKAGGPSTASVSLVPLDKDFYAAYRDGRSLYLVSRYQVEDIFDKAEEILQ
jgi:hypothetical protein